MNNRRRTKIISYLLTASFALSFWICVEGCQAEVEVNSETNYLTLQNISTENSEADFCSIQTAPSAFFLNQELFVPANSELPYRSRKTVSQRKFAPNQAYRTEKAFLKSPIQILCQLRI